MQTVGDKIVESLNMGFVPVIIEIDLENPEFSPEGFILAKGISWDRFTFAT